MQAWCFRRLPLVLNRTLVLAKMVGEEDGIVDGLFSFTRPKTGAFFWCPPMKDGQPDLSSIL